MAGSSQRRALGGLFVVLTLAFAGIAIAAGAAGQWVIVAAAAAIGVWLGGLADELPAGAPMDNPRFPVLWTTA